MQFCMHEFKNLGMLRICLLIACLLGVVSVHIRPSPRHRVRIDQWSCVDLREGAHASSRWPVERKRRRTGLLRLMAVMSTLVWTQTGCRLRSWQQSLVHWHSHTAMSGWHTYVPGGGTLLCGRGMNGGTRYRMCRGRAAGSRDNG